MLDIFDARSVKQKLNQLDLGYRLLLGKFLATVAYADDRERPLTKVNGNVS